MEVIADHRPRRNPIAWGLFLACSWTWCIGMFLPVLLVHDFGLWGWVVFTIPNVLGAAAMGWVIQNQEQSRQMVRRHNSACRAFSVVTILFHVYFVGWVIAHLATLPIALITVLLAAGLWMLIRTDRRAVRIAIIVYVLSLLAFLATFAYIGQATWSPAKHVAAWGGTGVIWLAPVCFLGFLTCPYLDLTFHRVRQSASRDGAKVAFGTGFVVFFFLMVLFTLWYADAIYYPGTEGGLRTILTWIVAGHMILQSAFTVSAHLRELLPPQSTEAKFSVPTWIILLIIPIIIAITLGTRTSLAGIGYLIFLSFYALIAPAYVCCSIRGANPAWIVPAVVLAAPLYWLGFINGWTIWLLPGVAIVLLFTLLPRRLRSESAIL